MTTSAFTPPPPTCNLCPRLVAFREANQAAYPSFYNGAVPSFGELSASLLVVGLAPGLKGANRTGRPFTGDYAGLILYRGLLNVGLAEGAYEERPDDGLTLKGVRITNSARCVPPENKPTPAEVKMCGNFLKQELAAMPNLKVILSLGLTSHQSVVKNLGGRQVDYKFAHGAVHRLPNGIILADSYHTSRYNISTGRLTQAMFDEVLMVIKATL
ncbi:MAG: uracil-DNA glycosylase [Alphaproteobacteria bacterium]|nr:uracil-DNA glycosylase [Alphaproteobacteria bacterium]